jgi:tetratricopeptide (TPR) repeat protein
MNRGKPWIIGTAAILATVAVGAVLCVTRRRANNQREVAAAECRVARRDQRWDELRRLAAGWASREPRAADPWLFLAEAAQGLGDASAAADAIGRVPETDPRVVPALIGLASSEFGPLNRPLEAEAAYLRALQLEPRNLIAHQSLIKYYAVSLQRQKLVRQIRLAIERQSEPPEAYLFLFLLDSMRIGNSVELNEHWLQASPNVELFLVARAVQLPDSADALVSVPPGQGEFELARSSGKLSLVEALLEKFPGNPELIAYAIESYRTRGEVDRVAELLARAPESADSDSRFWAYKGWVHEMVDEWPDAEAAYQTALEINGLDWNVRNRLASCRRRRKDHAQVERLTDLVVQAIELRTRIRGLRSPENVTPEMLAGISSYARKCGVDWVADAIDRKLGERQSDWR